MKQYFTLKEFFKELIPDDKELDAFGFWAFGEEWPEIKFHNAQHCWNYHHSKELELKSDGVVAEDAPKMIMLWRASK